MPKWFPGANLMTTRRTTATYRRAQYAAEAIRRTRMGILMLLLDATIVFIFLTPNYASAARCSILVLLVMFMITLAASNIIHRRSLTPDGSRDKHRRITT